MLNIILYTYNHYVSAHTYFVLFLLLYIFL
nr:MAG TPA: hypothetical protein [Caudoviricetes sp.]